MFTKTYVSGQIKLIFYKVLLLLICLFFCKIDIVQANGQWKESIKI